MNTTDAERIHETALALLDDPGVRIEHDDVRRRLFKGGADRGADAETVRFPRGFIEDCLARAPKEIRLADRTGGDGRVLSADSPSTVWSCPGMHLVRRGEHRLFGRDDMADAARLLDRLEHVDGVFGLAMHDVPPAARDVVGLGVMARNTRKHIRVLCFTPEGAEALTRMLPVGGEGAWFSIGFTAHGPLRWTRLALDIFAKTAGCGIPVTLNGEPTAGASGPVTLAGSAAVGNAEILAGLAVNQTVEPGRPCIYNLGLAHFMDMRRAVAVTGGPENILFARLSALMGRFYGLPSCSWVSTEAMVPDAQAAMEKGLGFRGHLDAGVSLVWGAGQLESEMTFSPAQAVVDDEILGACARADRGVSVDDETLALDIVREVGVGGDFLATDHTFAHFRSELWEPETSFRGTREAWTADGARDMAARAEDRVDELLAEDAEPCLDPDRDRELRAVEEDFLADMDAPKG